MWWCLINDSKDINSLASSLETNFSDSTLLLLRLGLLQISKSGKQLTMDTQLWMNYLTLQSIEHYEFLMIKRQSLDKNERLILFYLRLGVNRDKIKYNPQIKKTNRPIGINYNLAITVHGVVEQINFCSLSSDFNHSRDTPTLSDDLSAA